MKTLFALTAFISIGLLGNSALAAEIPMNLLQIYTFSDTDNEFINRYNLDSFKISTDSYRLKGMGEIVTGSVEVNELTNQLRLTLQRHINCPAGQLCIALAPAPTVITLPIRHIETSNCGATTILAERNLQLVDGGLTRVEVKDMNGRCDNADDVTFVKRITVTVTEEGARDRREIVSVMSGFPFQSITVAGK